MNKLLILLSAIFFGLALSCKKVKKEELEETEEMKTESTTTIDSKLDSVYFSALDKGYTYFLEEVKMDSAEFQKLYDKYKKIEKPLRRITNIDSVRALTKATIEVLPDEEGTYQNPMISKIKFVNGEVKNFNVKEEEGIFVAYYPLLDFLLMEGALSSDEGYDLKTGQDIYEVGNPNNQLFSPNKKYRISGIYPGHERIDYVLQDVKNGEFRKIADLDHWQSFENFNTYFWTNDSTFYYHTESRKNPRRLTIHKLPVNEFIVEGIDSKYKFHAQQIDSTDYHSLRARYYRKEAEPFMILSVDSLREALDGDIRENNGQIQIKNIRLINSGSLIEIDIEEEYGFMAYYPDYYILLMEGGHSSTIGYDVRTGESVYDVGNPATQTFSPNHKYRISEIWSGQECSDYIIQKIDEEGRYTKIGVLDDISNLCYYTDYFWENDTTFYYRKYGYMDNSKEYHQYYKMIIKQ